MVIRILDIVDGCDTHVQGDVVNNVIADALASGQRVVLSFDGVPSATSSFVNAAFVELLADHSFDKIKKLVALRNAHRQIASLVRDRMRREATPTTA